MGKIIKELDNNLVIFKPQDETKTDDMSFLILPWDPCYTICKLKFIKFIQCKKFIKFNVNII